MSYRSFIENKKNQQSKRDSSGSVAKCQRLVLKMVSSPFVPRYCISFMQIYFWFYIVSPCVTPFGSGVVSTLWLSGSSLDEILLLSGHVSEVWLATVCPVQTCVPTLQHTKPCCPRENQFHNWAIVTTLTT